jgi:hypothetical protein
MAAGMLHFREYADFADYFGSRWHFYLGDIIAGIPMSFYSRLTTSKAELLQKRCACSQRSHCRIWTMR